MDWNEGDTLPHTHALASVIKGPRREDRQSSRAASAASGQCITESFAPAAVSVSSAV